MSSSDHFSQAQFGSLKTNSPRLPGAHNADLDDDHGGEPDPLSGDLGSTGEDPGTSFGAVGGYGGGHQWQG